MNCNEPHKLHYYNLIDWSGGREKKKSQLYKATELMVLKMELTCSLTGLTKWTIFFFITCMICKIETSQWYRETQEQHLESSTT